MAAVVQSYESYVIAYQEDGGLPILACFVWTEYDQMISASDRKAPVMYIHAVLKRDLLSHRLARKFVYDFLGTVFQRPLVQVAVFCGIRENTAHRFFKRQPFGNLSWLRNSSFHPEIGVTDYWEWSVTKSEYATIEDEFEQYDERVTDGREKEGTGSRQADEDIQQEPIAAGIGPRPVWERDVQPQHGLYVRFAARCWQQGIDALRAIGLSRFFRPSQRP